MRFGGGMIRGLLLGAAGDFGFLQVSHQGDPCQGHCGSGTSCVDGACVVAQDDGARVGKRRGRRRRGRRRGLARGEVDEILRKPGAADMVARARGPSLKQADYVNMEEQGGGERELDGEDVDRRFRRLDRAIIACIDEARKGWDVSSGTVVVAFRIERGGGVASVRVKAPALLQRQGIYECIRPLVVGLRFPPSSRALVMRYPYRLD